jgi:hypothetical protein
MSDKRSIVVEINGYPHELELDGAQVEGLKRGHEVDDWFRDMLWQQGGASFEPVKDDPRYREDENGPWMEMVIRVSPPDKVDCLRCEGSGEWERVTRIEHEHEDEIGNEIPAWIECPTCKGSGKQR